VEAGYARGENDEFIIPTVIDGVDHGAIADGDAVLHCNFRADRARQLSHALADADFTGFDRNAAGPAPKGILYATMTAYEADLPVQVVFGPEVVPRSPRLYPKPAGPSSTSPRRRSTPM